MSSPTVRRAVSVIAFFADHPGKSFTLSEIAGSLHISLSTCHVLLKEFVEAGFLFRSSDKAYHLGPMAYRLADSARRTGTPLRAAEPVMRRLADRHDAICLAMTIEDGRSVIRESAYSASHLGWRVTPALPNDPPVGAAFMAWADPEQVRAWLDTSPRPIGRQERERVATALALARALGFSFGYRTVTVEGKAHAESLLYRADRTEYLPERLDPDAEYSIAYIAAPVFDERGGVAFLLALVGFGKPSPGAQLLALGTELRTACDEVSQAIGGIVIQDDEVYSGIPKSH